MKNFVQRGETLTLTAPFDLQAGMLFKVGSILAVATSAASSGQPAEAITMGVFDVTKVTAEPWAVGQLIYLSAAASSVATSVATSNTLLGVATAVASSPSTTGRIKLRGAFG